MIFGPTATQTMKGDLKLLVSIPDTLEMSVEVQQIDGNLRAIVFKKKDGDKLAFFQEFENAQIQLGDILWREGEVDDE